MKTKRLIAALGAGALLAAGGVLALAAPASAHTPSVTADCDGLTVNLTGYAAEQQATDAVTHLEYTRYSYNPKGSDKSGPDADSTPLTDPDHWTSNTHDYEGAGHGTDPVNRVFHGNDGNNGNGNSGNGNDNGNGDWFYWLTTTVVDQAAQTAETNTVEIVIDGATAVDTTFGTSYHYTSPAPDQTKPHTYQVTVRGWDHQGAVDFSQTVDACATAPIIPEQPAPRISTSVELGTVDCDTKTMPQTTTTWSTPYVWNGEQWTLATDGYVDGVWKSGSQWVSAETVDVPATGGDLANCPVTTDPIENEEPAVSTDDPSETPTDDPSTPAVVTAPAADQTTTPATASDELAQTGSDIPIAAIAVPLGALVLGAIALVFSGLRRRRAAESRD